MQHNKYTGNQKLDAAIDMVHRSEDVLLIVLLWTLSIVVMIQVISRYVFSNSLPWTEEVARLLIIYATFIGGFLTSRTKNYISIDLITRYFPQTKRTAFILRNLLMVAFYGYLAFLSYNVTERTWHQELTTLPISNGITYAVPTFALAVLSLRTLFQTFLALFYPAFSVDPVEMEDINA